MTEERAFIGMVKTTGAVTIPSRVRKHLGIEEGDTLTLKITSHRRDGKELIEAES